MATHEVLYDLVRLRSLKVVVTRSEVTHRLQFGRYHGLQRATRYGVRINLSEYCFAWYWEKLGQLTMLPGDTE